MGSSETEKRAVIGAKKLFTRLLLWATEVLGIQLKLRIIHEPMFGFSFSLSSSKAMVSFLWILKFYVLLFTSMGYMQDAGRPIL